MSADAGRQEGKGPTIVACDPWVDNFIRGIVPDCRIPPIWETTEPIAMLRDQAADARIAVSWGGFPFDEAMIEALPALEFVQIVGSGYDGLDTAALARRGIPFATGGHTNSADVADYAVAMAMAVRRDLLPSDDWVRSGRWSREGRAPIRRSFSADRVGIIGLGAIGQDIAMRLAGFGMQIRWWGPREKPGERLPRAESLSALAQWATILFACCPLLPETDRLVDAGIFDALGPEGIYVTVARGAVTDEDALIAALREGRLGGAGLDVFAQEPTPPERWADVPNILLSPHHAGVSIESQDRMRADVAENIRRFLAGETPKYLAG
ncbi:MAG TPA: NAD(P)-dependent oxidoreductase [Sphingobium sp.]|nr:NAD(P)-dependent oxidoreductase [Sphingobium sp.]